jgi:hypothetical protein
MAVIIARRLGTRMLHPLPLAWGGLEPEPKHVDHVTEYIAENGCHYVFRDSGFLSGFKEVPQEGDGERGIRGMSFS